MGKFTNKIIQNKKNENIYEVNKVLYMIII